MATSNSPIGLRLFLSLRNSQTSCSIDRTLGFKIFVLLATFVSYTCYHMTRKPLSVVKNVLNRNCTALDVTSNTYHGNSTNWCDWRPFDGSDASGLLGSIDSVYLFAYAIAMFGSGFVAERTNLRYFLSLGLVLAGIFTGIFGFAFTLKIHSVWFFIIVQLIGGIVQSTGWPAVVTIVGNWFGKARRGLIFGIWNSHTNIGNILGSLIAGAFVNTDWGLSFIIPGLITVVVGVMILLFLPTTPEEVGCKSVDEIQKVQESSVEFSAISTSSITTEKETPNSKDLESQNITVNEPKAISFIGALTIPGVVEFSLSLFFAKLVCYTFLYWLPKYISDSTTFDPEESADLSTLFDVGGIIGAIVAGLISDYTGKSAATCVVMLILALPSMVLYQNFGNTNLATSIVLLMLVGLLVNGPYCLITTSVSAELGTHESLQGNSKALATVTAIIDGTGSIGAAVGPLLAGLVSSKGWDNVFYMLMVSNVLAFLLLLRLLYRELSRFCCRSKSRDVQQR